MDKAETEAIQNVLAGNRDAYRVLMDRHFCSVTRVAFRITGNEADAEEAAQEAFLRAYNKLPTFRQDSTFSTWIMRITMNTAINLVERRNRDLSYHAPRISDETSTTNHTVKIADRQAGPEGILLNREAAVLENFGRVLTTLDNEPPTSHSTWRLRLEMNTSGLLLDIRILRQNDDHSQGVSQ